MGNEILYSQDSYFILDPGWKFILIDRFSLEIQRDENEALKTALQSTLKAKEEDLKMYSDTIDETKKVFLQALRQYKQTVHGT